MDKAQFKLLLIKILLKVILIYLLTFIVFDLLINSEGFKVNLSTFTGTALHLACKKNNKKMIELLLQKNPDLQLKNFFFIIIIAK